jgi:hypothetical protein
MYSGKVDGCDFYINIYGWHGYWMYTIRSKKRNSNLIVGTETYKTLREAKKGAAKWAVVQFLRQIDPEMFGSYRAHNTLCWF